MVSGSAGVDTVLLDIEETEETEGSWENSDERAPWRSPGHTSSATGPLSFEEEEGPRVRASVSGYKVCLLAGCRAEHPGGPAHPLPHPSADTLRGIYSPVS